ncbi:MAG: DUF5320 domain-containing protein [Dehalococcoidales bacterium]|nr:DUF5320 domain-containing protein [Dehalococcoidales bacterium]
MPNYDGTGPDGKGPMTGLGRGYCIIPVSSSKHELNLLKNQERLLQAQLKQIKSRIKEVKS